MPVPFTMVWVPLEKSSVAALDNTPVTVISWSVFEKFAIAGVLTTKLYVLRCLSSASFFTSLIFTSLDLKREIVSLVLVEAASVTFFVSQLK